MQGIGSIFYNNYRWSISFKNCESLYSILVTYIISSVQSLNCVQLFETHGLQHAGFPVHHQLPELAQTHVHQVGDAIQPSHPLSTHSPPAFNLSQHQGLFKWVSSLHQVAKVLEFQFQHQSFQLIFRTNFLQYWLVWSPCSPRDSQESSQHHSSKVSFFPGWMHETGALGTPRGIGWRGRWGGGTGMGNTCKSMADSFQCMTKTTAML